MFDYPGFEEQSIWGFDEQTKAWFAQIWPNGADDDKMLWVNGFSPPMHTQSQLTEYLAQIFRCTPDFMYMCMERGKTAL